MRRAWLLALLASPAIAAAQTPPTPPVGQITVGEVLHSPIDRFIDAAECNGPGIVHLGWQVPGTIPGTGVTYRLFAANQGSSGECPMISIPTSNLIANEVLPRLPSNINPMFDTTYATTAIAAAAGFDPVTCNSTSAPQQIFLCVEAFDPTSSTTLAGVGPARGQLTLDRRPPATPTGVSASPGDGALNVSWNLLPGTNDPPGDYYIVDATPVDTTLAFDPAPIHSSGPVTGTPFRLAGLVNNVVYNVRVFSFSPADNRCPDPTTVVTGIPELVNDFWETYKADGGREQGGCASGPAGLVALLGAVALLVALRRRS